MYIHVCVRHVCVCVSVCFQGPVLDWINAIQAMQDLKMEIPVNLKVTYCKTVQEQTQFLCVTCRQYCRFVPSCSKTSAHAAVFRLQNRTDIPWTERSRHLFFHYVIACICTSMGGTLKVCVGGGEGGLTLIEQYNMISLFLEFNVPSFAWGHIQRNTKFCKF